MKKFFLFTLALLAFAACTQNDVEELAANRADVPETLTVGFEGDDTRIQLNEAQKTVWNRGDNISVFYRSDANQKWQFQGETGDRQGQFKRTQNAESSTSIANIVVAYPYSEEYFLNTKSYNIEATLPAVQHYAEGSYGVGDNLMVAQSEFTQFSLKSVCGWLKIQLTGNGEKVTSLTLRGNKEEQLAGLIYVDTATAESTLASEMGSSDDNNAGGNLIFDDAIVTELTLDCGEGVVLGAEATAFYIAVPPQTFEGGFTVDVECKDYEPMTISTENSVTIQRNTIQPMATIELDADAINDTIYYTATAKINKSWDFNTFGANILSHEWNSKTGEGIITFDTDVTTIGKYAFEDCLNLTGITIPDSVTTIGEGAFYLCRYLTGITIPNSVTTIGKMAFTSCSSLTNITIPDSVTTIGEAAFGECTNLVEFNGKFASEDGRCLIVDGTLNSFAPAGLTSYTIPDSVTTIGWWAFGGCNSLTSVTIPDSVTTIGYAAFGGCDSLTSVTIGDSVTTIGDWAFCVCDSLTSVTIPDSVTTIGERAFAYCYSLTSVYCKATTPPSLDSNVFDDNASDRKIYVPFVAEEAYKNAQGWSEYADYIVGNGPTPEFEPTHIANECMWGGYSSISWGNYYIVSGEGFSMQVHFCTDVATETTLATGDYKWAGITIISNSTPEKFSTKAIKINGADVYAANGEMSVTEKNGVYTIKLSIVNRDTNETYGILFNGKLNEAGPEIKESVVNVTRYNDGGQDGTLYARIFKLYDNNGNQAQLYINADAVNKDSLVVTPGTYTWVSIGQVGELASYFSTNNIVVNGESKTTKSGTLVVEESGEFTMSLTMTDLSKVKFVVSKEYLGK